MLKSRRVRAFERQAQVPVIDLARSTIDKQASFELRTAQRLRAWLDARTADRALDKK